MTYHSRHIACFCENSFDAQIPESADLAADPGVQELIQSGDFMAVSCPSCGKRLTPEFPFRLTGVMKVGEIFLIPEADRAAFVRGRLEYDVGKPGRIVVGFPELAEKVLICTRGLDDRVIEIMKYYLLTGAAAGGDQEHDKDVTLAYRGVEGDKHLFHILGIKAGEVGVARLAEQFYQKIASDVESRVREEPFRDFCEPPWVSLRKAAGGLG
ncbi:MAG: CpXC domain-containing protein [Spirochaetia bacterium]|jgi:hypothetical protein